MPEAPYSKREEDELILRDYLAIDRTVLANERTILAYLRTSLTFLIVGLSFVKFFDTKTTFYLGWVFFICSVIVLLAGLFRFRQMNTRIHRPRGRS